MKWNVLAVKEIETLLQFGPVIPWSAKGAAVPPVPAKTSGRNSVRGKLVERALTVAGLHTGQAWPPPETVRIAFERAREMTLSLKQDPILFTPGHYVQVCQALLNVIDEKASSSPLDMGTQDMQGLLVHGCADFWSEVVDYVEELEKFLTRIKNDEVPNWARNMRDDEFFLAAPWTSLAAGPKADGGAHYRLTDGRVGVAHLDVKTHNKQVGKTKLKLARRIACETDTNMAQLSIKNFRGVAERLGYVPQGTEPDGFWAMSGGFVKALPYEQTAQLLIVTPNDYLFIEAPLADASEEETWTREKYRLSSHKNGVWCYGDADEVTYTYAKGNRGATLSMTVAGKPTKALKRAWLYVAQGHFPDIQSVMINSEPFALDALRSVRTEIGGAVATHVGRIID